MSLGPGGIADKQGNVYENSFLGMLLVRLIVKDVKYVIVEPMDSGSADMMASYANGQNFYYQCKSSCVSGENWAVRNLSKIGFFKNSKEIFAKGENNIYCLVSPFSGKYFQDLLSRAESFGEAPDVFFCSLSEKLKNELSKVANEYNLDYETPDEAGQLISILKHCRFAVINIDEEFIKTEENLIRLLFEGDPSAVRILLENYANDGRLYRTEIIAADVVDFLSKKGFSLINNRIDISVLIRLNESFKSAYMPLGGSLLHRDVSDKIVSKIQQGKSLLVQGSAGVGKSGCLVDIAAILEQKGIPYLAVRLDKYIPSSSALEFGRSLGLNSSPVGCLYELAGGRSAVLILDQLDSLCWVNDSSAATAIDVCKELIREAIIWNQNTGGKIAIIFASRTIDIENDHELQSLFVQANANGFERIEIPVLEDMEVKGHIGDEYEDYPQQIRKLLRLPFALYLWLDLENKSLEVPSVFNLIHSWWLQILKKGEKSGISNSEIDECKNAIVGCMQKKRIMSCPSIFLYKHNRSIQFLISNGLIVQDNNRKSISFMHQSFHDYFISIEMLERVNSGIPFSAIIEEEVQIPILRYRLSLALQCMLQFDESAFLRNCGDILASDSIHYYIKCVVFEILGQLSDPSEEVISFINRYYREDEWKDFILRSVYYGHPVYVRRFFDDISEFNFKNSLHLALIESIDNQDPDYVATLLAPYADLSEESARIVLRTICNDPADDSDKMFDLRLKIFKKYYGFLESEVIWLNTLMEVHPERTIQLLLLCLEADIDCERLQVSLGSCDSIGKFARSNSAEIIKDLYPAICSKTACFGNPWSYETRILDKDFYQWCKHKDRESFYREMVSLVEIAIEESVTKRGNEIIEGIISCSRQSMVGHEIISNAILKLPYSEADYAIRWLVDDFKGRVFVFTYDDQDYLFYSKKIIEKFSDKCNESLAEELEAKIYGWNDPKEIWKRNSLSRSLSKNNRVVFPLWGYMQHELLPLLARRSDKSEDLIRVLGRRSKYRIKAPYYCYSQSSVIYRVPPFGEKAEKISDNAWLKILSDNEICEKRKKRNRRDSEKDFSERGIAADLQRQAQREPERYSGLVLRLSADCYSGYFLAIIQGVASAIADKKVSNMEPVCSMIERCIMLNNPEITKEVLRLVNDNSEYNWPDNILIKIKELANTKCEMKELDPDLQRWHSLRFHHCFISIRSILTSSKKWSKTQLMKRWILLCWRHFYHILPSIRYLQ